MNTSDSGGLSNSIKVTASRQDSPDQLARFCLVLQNYARAPYYCRLGCRAGCGKPYNDNLALFPGFSMVIYIALLV